MLTKILITALIIVGALFYLRKPPASVKSQGTSKLGQQMMFRYLVYGLIATSLLASGGYWYWNWQDGNQVVSVTIVSPLEESSETYQVRKKDILANEITTLDGLSIRLSNQERVIIAKSIQE
ncbi:hypothetical protein [Shewanella woodyi]|uniref:Uncharacterized protein n=1 Tax=Shewanella woodyi (strain ATCC 51908 / MS32) TaxID=392500 RepID=B1KJ65_SHEWM|nr:hypothetical protein [Shewanella woodyi]ACA87085.1 conserved hypothetical protein [Shewanella woodyi ATCC 51908]